MTMRHTILAGLLVVSLSLAGCLGDGGTPDQPTGEQGPSADWCVRGETYSTVNPQTGERARLTVEGVVTHEGRQTCKSVLEQVSGEEIASMESYYTRDEEYVHLLLYDTEGTLRLEMKQSDGQVQYRSYDENGTLEQEYNSSTSTPSLFG